MTAVAEKATASDMIAMLRRHYIADEAKPGGIFAAEIAAPGSSRRADLIWQGVTASSGSELHGHEVKVSRADLVTELADPTKSDPWQRYCDRWWLVVPDLAMLDGLVLPPTWGVLTPPSGRRTRSCTVTVKAPKLDPAEQAPALRTLAAWLHWSRHRLQNNVADLRADLERQRQETSRAREDVQYAHVSESERRRREVVSDIVRQLGSVGADGTIGGIIDGTVSVDDVVAALRDIRELNSREYDARKRAEWALDDLRRTAKSLAQAVTQAEKR